MQSVRARGKANQELWGTALQYTGAVVGVGACFLPGLAFALAGRGSLLSWGYQLILGIFLGQTFSALTASVKGDRGVPAMVGEALGPAWGAVVGWFYFWGFTVGQGVVTLVGAYHLAALFHGGRAVTFATAEAILLIALFCSLMGIQLSKQARLALTWLVILLLAATAAAGLQQVRSLSLPANWEISMRSVGESTFLLFFAFVGWESILRLGSERRMAVRATQWAALLGASLLSLLYLGTAAAVITNSGDASTSQVYRPLALVANAYLGSSAATAIYAIVGFICILFCIKNVSATVQLGHQLSLAGAFPIAMRRLNRHKMSVMVVATVGIGTSLTLWIAYHMGWEASTLIRVPNAMALAIYLISSLVGTRLLRGASQFGSLLALILSLAIIPFAGWAALIPVGIAAAALSYRTTVQSSNPVCRFFSRR